MSWSAFRDIRFLPEGGSLRTVITVDPPACAVDGAGHFHIVYSDLHDDKRLRHITRAPKDRHWREVWGLSRLQLRGLPAIAFVGEKLHLVSVTPWDRRLHHATKTGDRLFESKGHVPGAWTRVRVSLAATRDGLHMAHHDQNPTRRVYHSTYSGVWSPHVWVNGLTSAIPPILSHAAGRVQLWTTNARGVLRMSVHDPVRGNGFQPMRRIKHPTRLSGEPAIHGVRNANVLMIATAADPALFTQPSDDSPRAYLFSRGRDDGRTTARARIPDSAFQGAPVLATSRKTTLIAGLTIHSKLRESSNGTSEVAKVGLGFKIHDLIARDFIGDLFRMEERTRKLIIGLNKIYGPHGLKFFERTPPEKLDLPASFLEMNAGRCLLNAHSDEQRALFSHRNGLQKGDIGVYVVQSIRKVNGDPLGGCGSPRMNACMVVPWTSAELLGHEVGHAMGLKHTSRPENLMTPDQPAGSIELVAGQVEKAMRSDSALV